MKTLREALSDIEYLKKAKKIQYLCGWPVEKFYILIHSLMHFSQIIKYPECKGNGVRKLEK